MYRYVITIITNVKQPVELYETQQISKSIYWYMVNVDVYFWGIRKMIMHIKYQIEFSLGYEQAPEVVNVLWQQELFLFLKLFYLAHLLF